MQLQNDSSYDMSDASRGTPTMTGWLIKYSGGLIANKEQAALVMVGIAIVAFLFSIILFVAAVGGTNTSAPPTSPEIENAGAPQYM